MTRAREAVDAAMLASAIGIDRTVERHVWRIVARDDAARRVRRQRRPRRGRNVIGIPSVVHSLDPIGLETARRVGGRAAALACERSGHDAIMNRVPERNKILGGLRRALGERVRRLLRCREERFDESGKPLSGVRRTAHRSGLPLLPIPATGRADRLAPGPRRCAAAAGNSHPVLKIGFPRDPHGTVCERPEASRAGRRAGGNRKNGAAQTPLLSAPCNSEYGAAS